MSIKIKSYGGIIIWCFRKRKSYVTSSIFLPIAAAMYKSAIDGYIKWFFEQPEIPCFKSVMIETINRCNGECAFCPANRRAEKREFKQMSNELFDTIIEQLKKKSWIGQIYLNVNNEPFIDKRILSFATKIREHLPKCEICIISNGTLLNVEIMKEMVPLVDSLVINNYSKRYRLNENIREIYKYVKRNETIFSNMKIVIKRRYSEEILATRAGNAPNKAVKNNKIKSACIYPFMDLVIFPDGKVGMCCNDCFEVTNFGDINTEDIMQIWQNEHFTKLRQAMRTGNRENYKFCKECDVVDAGSREEIIKNERKRQIDGKK